MPIFEYKCQDCNHEFDILVTGSNKGIIKCPQCLSDKVNKKWSLFNTGGKSSSAPAKCQTCSRSNECMMNR